MTNTQSIRVVGGVLPPSLIGHLQDGTLGSAESRSAKSYHLIGSESVRDGAARAWSYLRGAWRAWHEADQGRVEGSAGTGPARERWLLPLLRELGYGQVPAAGHGLTIDGVDYPVSHLWQHVPVHLLGPGVSLDKRNPGIAGAARAPQAMVQELLNRTDQHLWAILSNGSRLRLLRDSTALVGSAYVEFDLEAIFEGELYAEWLILFQLAHVSRLEVRSEEGPASCWLETWRGEATDAGARALGRLESGVERSLGALGTGFLTHPANSWLLEALRSGEIGRHDYHRALLRLVYRLLFTFVAEDRDLLLDPARAAQSRERYAAYFSTARLRRLSRVRAGGPHGDLWHPQRVVLTALGTDGLADLALTALGGVFSPDARQTIPASAPDQRDLLWGAEIANADLLSAVAHLAWITTPSGRTQPVDYRHLGAEELGSVYEALLELDPSVDVDERTFAVERVIGNDRKTTGSYYTSPNLVSALLDTALDPVIDRVAPLGVDPEAGERALLGLTVCDPACGSGGFLVAAARRIAHRLAEVRAGDDTPTPEMVHHAMRDVVGRCIYGVDLNDLAAELAKVSLWIEALEPGKPLSFLDARIRTGNALFGTTPALLERGVPDEAFKEIGGDDKAIAATLRRKNKSQHTGQGILSFGSAIDMRSLADDREALLGNADDIEGVEKQRELWSQVLASGERQRALRQADAWCAAFVWPLTAETAATAPTTAIVSALAGENVPSDLEPTQREVHRLKAQYRFFHWHLEFPEVFLGDGEPGSDGWSGGFSCMLGNPPWEHVELKEQEYFAARDPEIASAAGAKRKKLIAALAANDPVLDTAYRKAKREVDGLRHFASAGRYPLTGRGRVKTDPIFAELFRSLTAPDGRTGVIVPTGIATDATTQFFFKDLVQTKSLAALYDFENAKPLFEGVHRSFKFCLLSLTGRRDPVDAAAFAFFLHDPSEIAAKQFALTPEEITLLNPNTGTCPIFRTRRDAEITLGIYRRVPVLIREGDPRGNPWEVSFMQGLFNVTTDSNLFGTYAQLVENGWTLDRNVFRRGVDAMLPLYEAKMVHQFDNRWATYERDGSVRAVTTLEKGDPYFASLPRYWVGAGEVASRLDGRWNQSWLMGWRDIARATDERTAIASFVGEGASPEGGTLLVLPRSQSVHQAQMLLASFNSFAFDFVARQKVGGTHLKYFTMRQLPVHHPATFDSKAAFSGLPLRDWIAVRVSELVATSCDTQPLIPGEEPFNWNVDRRRHLRVELDAAFFHLYGVDRDGVDYIMETFPIVKRKDIAAHGEYRTKRLILEVYDAMQKAIETETEYQTILDPPPGEGPRHPAKES
ncbi:Eco57I restriction-modification methylase domain-containing protein [Knoellia aerolata]|uniref:site-specific DNA-methyltransferase (adenine-specific) n=1 Tax=Knoellia aerolata DSM 18566 TaxID=1385519 RepID=A0A0A0JVH2_9MICO|nr:DNA methyltransferase [Knoellia aerolata]KGN41188.1 hypothetical protein N801_08890 [Knoellia aerolata DSM 18566]